MAKINIKDHFKNVLQKEIDDKKYDSNLINIMNNNYLLAHKLAKIVVENNNITISGYIDKYINIIYNIIKLSISLFNNKINLTLLVTFNHDYINSNPNILILKPYRYLYLDYSIIFPDIRLDIDHNRKVSNFYFCSKINNMYSNKLTYKISPENMLINKFGDLLEYNIISCENEYLGNNEKILLHNDLKYNGHFLTNEFDYKKNYINILMTSNSNHLNNLIDKNIMFITPEFISFNSYFNNLSFENIHEEFNFDTIINIDLNLINLDKIFLKLDNKDIVYYFYYLIKMLS